MATPTNLSGSGAPKDRIVGGILVRDHHVLLGHRHPDRANYPNCWDVPGGHVEPAESAVTALKRELVEEIGIVPELAGPDPDFRLEAADFDLRLWVIRTWTGEVANRAPDEHDTLDWFTAEQLTDLTLADRRYVGILTGVLAAGT